MMRLRIVQVLLTIFLTVNSLFAQGDPREILKNLTYEQQAQLQKQISEYRFTQEELNESAERYGVKPDSRHIMRMLGKHPKNPWEQEISELKIFGHVKGNSGINYPDPLVIKNSYKKFTLNQDAVRQYVREEYLPQLKAQVSQMEQAIPLPKCTSSSTIRKNISKTNNQSGNTPVQDLLFISPEKVPNEVDVSEFLGKKVDLLVYYPDKNTEIHRVAKGLGVECLPMRFRTTTEAFFVDRGINALKNYDEDYHSSGILHPYFK